MKGFMRALAIVVSLGLLTVLLVPDAEARRMGGGRSIGRQSTLPAQRAATPQRPQQAQQATAGAAGQQPQRNRWLAPIAGLAAGLGLAALANHLGLGEQFANLIMMALLAFAALAAFRYFAARRMRAPEPALAGAGMQRTALPESALRPAAQGGAAAPGTSPDVGLPGVPADFDAEAFLRTAKVQFIRLQAAFDAANLADLREFTTPEMFAELKLEIDERAGRANRTDVVTLDAELMGIDSDDERHVASVRFAGMLREAEGAAAEPFAEAWNLVKPARGAGGWLLAGIQQLH